MGCVCQSWIKKLLTYLLKINAFDAPCCHIGTAILCQTGLSRHLEFLTSGHSDAQPWASKCPDVKKFKWRLNPVWHRMLYSCTHMTTVGVTLVIYPWAVVVLVVWALSRRASRASSSERRSRPGQAQIRSSTDWRPSTCPSRSRVNTTWTGRRPRPPTHELKHMNWNRFVTHSAPAASHPPTCQQRYRWRHISTQRTSSRHKVTLISHTIGYDTIR